MVRNEGARLEDRLIDMQSKRDSLIEVLTNTITGLVGSWLITYAAIITVDDKTAASIVIVAGCTAWSLFRGWTIRRMFNRMEKRTHVLVSGQGGTTNG